ncbi:hypothetical protein PCASD_04728 [Puccinia coronata f. sp. avenae]|uniref:Carboxypeptidase n=1 Tax=Puccinia coronata f. sp. avenae TaxID=200324 RepID=A0A2N5UZ03_9BASI|nr:hypothetical protein PCASD_04728 [Puccinia coronata f. sp. avenae]
MRIFDSVPVPLTPGDPDKSPGSPEGLLDVKPRWPDLNPRGGPSGLHGIHSREDPWVISSASSAPIFVRSYSKDRSLASYLYFLRWVVPASIPLNIGNVSCISNPAMASKFLTLKFYVEAFKIFPKQITHGTRHVKGSYRYVVDSRVCETTPGVKSYSGYIDTGNNQSMFFWFFEARNNAKTAPLGLWLNGGPGCSSLFGALQENGPCQISSDSTTSKLNPYSWNTYANMLYIDQPISTGFSYGDRNVFSTNQAATRVWEFFQTFFSIPTFAQYANREMTFWSESYGGHYGPIFTQFFRAQNALIQAKKLQAHVIQVTSLGINNGWFDPYVQYQSYYDYAQSKFNHVVDMANPATLAVVKTALNTKKGCLAQLKNCANNGSNDVCQDADNFCAQHVTAPLLGNRSPYYFPHGKNDPFPSLSFLRYLDRWDVMRAIGAESKFMACQDDIGDDFWTTADGVRPTISSLGKLLDSGLRTVIWAGDKDFICNSLGVYRSLLATKWKYSKQFAKAPWKNLTVHGKVGGVYKTTGPLTYIRVYNAGHEVPAFQPALSLEIFKQTLSHQNIHSTN